MNEQALDPRFCTEAMNGLKAYGRIELTARVLKNLGLPPQPTLGEMWASVEAWIGEDPERCRRLWEEVDDLRLWGRQRIFLYEVDEEYARFLADAAEVEKVVGAVYRKPLYRWDAAEPFLASVRHTRDRASGDPLLTFKLIETRPFELVVDGVVEQHAERSTSFLRVNLRSRHAELRIQDLPTGARRNVREERERLWRLLGGCLDAEHFQVVDLVPLMDTLLRAPPGRHPFTITRFAFRSPEPDRDPQVPLLVAFLRGLFRRPDPAEVTAYWECEQDVLGACPLHFHLSGASDEVSIGGLADPDRVGDLLKGLLKVARSRRDHEVEKDTRPWIRKGAANGLLKELANRPAAKAVILSAGAIAASILWILAEAIGGYFYDELLAWVLRGLPVAVLTVPLEIFWVILYYGWDRVWNGFKALRAMTLLEFWRELTAAWKRRKASEGG